MLIVGELINTSRKAVKPAVEGKDGEFIKELAQKQLESGADYIDVNCGTQVFNEAETMEWLVNTIQETTDAPLCIDSPSEKALAAGLEAAQKNGKQNMVNSITAEKERYSAIIPLVQQYKTKVVSLLMSDEGMPQNAQDRIKVADKLVNDLVKDGLEEDQIYLDPLITPISTGDDFGIAVLDTIRYIRENYPKVHVTCGLSNISYGLPNRKIINRAFMAQTMAAGMDSYILDPLDKEMMGMVYASQALLGQDSYCTKYLQAHRKGLF